MKYMTLLALLATGCARYPHQSLDYPLANIPIESHERKVAVLFATDPLPHRPYIKVGVLEAYGNQFTSYNDLIRRLQARGQEMGVDAVQILQKHYIEDTEEDVITDWVDTDITSKLSGLGILYVDSATYLSQYVQAQEVHLYNEQTQQYDSLACRITLSYNGEDPEITGLPRYAALTRNYASDHLVYEETRDWWYTTDTYNRVRIRGYSPNQFLLKRVKLEYDDANQVAQAQIIYPNRTQESVQFLYDTTGHITEKQIELREGITLREIPAYNEQGRQVGSEFFQLDSAQTFQPYFRIVYHFFDPENLGVDESLVQASKK